MNNCEKFIEKYKELEYAINSKYNIPKSSSEVSFLARTKEFSKYRKELEYCREVRNFLQHETKIDKEFAIIPSDEMIKLIDKMIYLVNNPISCLSISKKLTQIFYKSLDDYVLESMLAIDHKMYSHIPIIENNKLVGVFSKTSIFNFLLEDNIDKLNSALKFKDIRKYIDLDAEAYMFCDEVITVNEMEELIVSEFKKGRKISMIFITSNALETGNVIGMFTPFDVMGY